ncbi:MAG: site-specific DNA-methyltransferase, partial [Calditrichaeota bacterium]|nr:site-specific DNA-methyltransferase [Calditrichota bacterium]
MKNLQLPRIDENSDLHRSLLKYCRLSRGEIWDDPIGRHRIGCLDAADKNDVNQLMAGNETVLAIQDPPYNLIAFEQRGIIDFVNWCRKWIINTHNVLSEDSSLYIWLGADQNNGFQPLPDFIIMM